MAQTGCDKSLEAASAMEKDAVRFTEVPRATRLFIDYMYNFDRVARFYSQAGRDSYPLAEFAKRVAAQPLDRQKVADALEDQNRRFGSPELTFEHIEMLRQVDSVAVVTGQQAGLFTGPLFSIHKALTAIKLASCLRSQGVKAVPVFWVASEDHDLEEVNHCKVVDTEGKLIEIRYACPVDTTEPVGQIKLCESINQQINELAAALPDSEFMPELLSDLRATYAPGTGFAEAFAKLLAKIFSKYGVVLLDPMDKRLKQVVSGLYSDAIRKTSQIAESLVEQSSVLEASGYHAQVHTSLDAVPLFTLVNGRRTAMVRKGDYFFLKNSDRCRSLDELLDAIQLDPSAFSPNVTLRPIVQDTLLPTVAYIGGPAEIAYFAQLRPVYNLLGRIEPCILPRASLTLIDRKTQKVLEKYRLKLQDFFEGQDAIIKKTVETVLGTGTAAVFDETEKVINKQLEKLRRSIARLDPTLADALKGGRKKIFYQLNHLRTRFVHVEAERNKVARRQIERASVMLYPEKNLQERELNVFYFLSRYGYSIIDDLYNAIDIGYSNHKIVYLGGVASSVLGAKNP